ncbi:MAG: selenide, water dikinase SelD, partial [Cyclobacteriaceae bacterium]
GHSIDCPEPVFGLAVTGKVKKEHLKQNNQAKVGSLLYLTKPLGIGIVTTAQKKGIVKEEHLKVAVDSMLTLNSFGAKLGKLPYVNALTDVTGFGLLGHLTEVCDGSNLSAVIEFDKVPVLNFLDAYIQQKSMPGGTQRNWESYGHKISSISDEQRIILADPQTSGGLLIAVDADKSEEFERVASDSGLSLKAFGKLIPKADVVVTVK